MVKYKATIGPLIFILHAVGVAGMLIPDLRPLFIQLTPLNLLLTAVLYTVMNQSYTRSFLTTSVLVFLMGFFVEVVGVQTGLLFGVYTYGDTLGTQILETPLLMGINWWMLAFSSHVISRQLTPSKLLQAVLGSSLMVGLDFLIEPTAICLDFWHWDQGVIPVQNYIMWWIAAFVIHLFIGYRKTELNPRAGLWIFGTQVFFFLVLTAVLTRS